MDEDAKLQSLRAKIAPALNDPRPSIPADEVFDRLETALSEGQLADLRARLRDPGPLASDEEVEKFFSDHQRQ